MKCFKKVKPMVHVCGGGGGLLKNKFNNFFGNFWFKWLIYFKVTEFYNYYYFH